MAESFLFEIAGQILGKLASDAIGEIGRIWDVESDLNRVELTVTAIKSVLLDAEDRKNMSPQVEDWLEKLQEAFDDADDLLDDFITEDLQRKIVIKGRKRKETDLQFTMSHKLKNITKRLEDIDAERIKFQLVKRVLKIPLVYPSREQMHSYVNASDVIGREFDKNRIIELLLRSSSASGSSINQNLCIFPIVGVGGLGKTTLAKLIYNDIAIISNFQKRLWVCVSEDFDLKKLIVKIVEDATGGIDHAHLDLNQLRDYLRSTLQSEKYFLVLDDVWNDDRKKWIMGLKDLLICGSRGSKVVITTRKESTAKIMGTLQPHKLKGLSKDECMSIFVNCAFRGGEDKEYPKLMEIGKEIVIKCGGLPLAVKCLGSLLYTKREEREWRYIRDNEILKVEQNGNGILPVLKLSYDELPRHLKQCFAYCASFPKDAEINNCTLIAEWIAHGYIQSSDGIRALEDIGNQYLRELISRSFFQEVRVTFDGTYISFKMHDLLHDLALSVADKMISHVDFNNFRTISKRTRHLLLREQCMEEKEFPNFLLKLNKVRSFSFMYRVGPITKTFLQTLIKTFKCLRVLILDGSEFEELPSSVVLLKHLRLLSIAGNSKIKELPKTISNLVNLQTLYLHGCMMLQTLRRDIGNMCGLRSLYITSHITCFPEKGLLAGLTSLQSLSISSCCRLESLSVGILNLTALRNLYINHCPNLAHLPRQSTKYFTSLDALSIRNCEKLNLFEEEEEEEEDDHEMMKLRRGLSSLELTEMPRLKEFPWAFEKAASTIKYLWIDNCPLRVLPKWLNKCKSLSILRVENCVLLESLPLGMDQLTALRTLHIINCCEELRRKCERETGEYWHWISRIAEVEIY